MAAPEDLATALARQPAAPAQDLAARLGVSLPTVHRLLRGAGAQVVTLGRARRTRHAWRRALRGWLGDWPVYRIDEQGAPHAWSTLALVAPQGCAMPLEGTGWPVPPDEPGSAPSAGDGWWPGLPYPLQDLRPQGYMGRQFARAVHEALQLPPDPRAWSDDDVRASRVETAGAKDLPARPAWKADPMNLFVVVEGGDHPSQTTHQTVSSQQRVRTQIIKGPYFNSDSTNTGVPASKSPAYPTHQLPKFNVKL